MNRIKELRVLNDYTQKQVAEWLSITQAAYSKYERGTSKPSFRSIAILCEKYGVSSDYLMGIETNNNHTTEFSQRLKDLRIQNELTQIELSKILNIAQPTLSGYETGHTEPDNMTLTQIANYFGVSVDYLLGRKNKKSPVIENEVELNDLYAVPLLGRVVAGVPLESQENLEGYIHIGYAPPQEYFALRVNGDSMINAGIRDKSVLVVHKQTYAENGEIVVALINGEATVKRFKLYGDNIFLMPENPAYEPIPVLKDADFLILGKVVEVRITF